MRKKYKLLENDTIGVDGRTLYRIKAFKNFKDVKKGDLGGYIEDQCNLSQDGDCWIYHNAKIYDDAIVYENASIYGNAEVYGNAKVYDSAWIKGNAKVYVDTRIFGYAEVSKEISGEIIKTYQ